MSIGWRTLEEKWRRRWDEHRVYESDPDPNKPKYFLTVAYPYPNSPQHIGHGRTYTLTDVHARYKRMQGYNVLLPMAFHYTGTPILAMSKRLASGDQELIDAFINIYKVPREVLKDFSDPLCIARYFHQELKLGMQEIGYGIDWRREFTTVDLQYSKFIEWQFNVLRKKGLIIQGSHHVGWCPNDENPIGQHDTMGDVEPEIGEYILVNFIFNDYLIPAATLRPETIFGVTNIWISPDVIYVKSMVDGKKWIISQECEEKLRFLNYNVVREGTILGSELIGKDAENPITKTLIPILPASFVDPKVGTGIVMSVPAHAPFDLQALEDLKSDNEELTKHGLSHHNLKIINPITIIVSKGYPEIPAKKIMEKMEISSQTDPNLENATSELYAHEFHLGVMKTNAQRYSGMKVPKARDTVKEDLIKGGHGGVFHEIMNGPVICRCETKCVVKLVKNQWFINYGDQKWKALASDCADKMSLLPEEIRSEFKYTIGWLREKACARKAGLGTKLPWDTDWLIESLSDSVIYMAYYLLAKFINKFSVNSDNLTDDVFHYVFFGEGDAVKISRTSGLDRTIIEDMRKEFTYFYPLDSRHSGRDLVPNHLTFFIFNHATIFPQACWPKQIVVNGSVLMDGKKMSKTYGNIIPLRDAVKTYGADPMRLTILAAAELLADADISLDTVRIYRDRLEKLYKTASTITKNKVSVSSNDLGVEDRWLLSRLQRHITKITDAMNNLRIREAIHYVIHILDQDIQWYTRRVSGHGSTGVSDTQNVMREVLDLRVRLLAPFAPFICEEIWELMGNSESILHAEWPKVDETKLDVEAEESNNLIRSLLEDTQNIIKVTKIRPKKIVFYISSPWKWKVYQKSLEIVEKGRINVGLLIQTLLLDSEMKQRAKEVSDFAKKLAEDSIVLSPEIKNIRTNIGKLDEFTILSSATQFLSKELKSQVHVFNEDDQNIYDPKNRSRMSRPFRPAIFLE